MTVPIVKIVLWKRVKMEVKVTVEGHRAGAVVKIQTAWVT